jgi:type IV pilus assembly protein PilC
VLFRSCVLLYVNILEEIMKKTLDREWVSSFCMEMHLILRAGIPVSDGVAMLAEESSDPGIKNLLGRIQGSMENGEKVQEAFLAGGGFPKYATDMIGIGEATGRLDTVFQSLSQYYDRQEQLSKTIKGAVFYPAILMVMMLFVIIIILTRVLPIFNQVFNQLGTTMTASASFLMSIGQAMNQYWKQIIMVFLAAAVLVFIVYRISKVNPKSFGAIRRAMSKRRLSMKIASAQFAAAMSMTMASGLDIDESLKMAEELVSSLEMKVRIGKCISLMGNGIGFPQASSQSNILSGLYPQLLSVGFRTGESDKAMEEIARRSQDEAEDEIGKIVSRIEPTLVIIMSLIVGLILVAVMLPLVSIMSSIG